MEREVVPALLRYIKMLETDATETNTEVPEEMTKLQEEVVRLQEIIDRQNKSLSEFSQEILEHRETVRKLEADLSLFERSLKRGQAND